MGMRGWARAAAWAGLTVLLAAGCGRAGKGTVTGRVTLDGNPVEKGTVQFFPLDGKGQTAHAPIRGGMFTAEVPVGVKRVEINAPRVAGQRPAYDTPDSPLVDVYRETIPTKYNAQSELRTEVKAGRNEADFPLTGK
jgi:hypothetical protein